MEKQCCEYKDDSLVVTCYETDDGYRIEVRGDKDRISKWKESCCKEGPFRMSCC